MPTPRPELVPRRGLGRLLIGFVYGQSGSPHLWFARVRWSPILDSYGRSWARRRGSRSKQAANDVFGFAVEWLQVRSWRRSSSTIPKPSVLLRVLLAGFVIMGMGGWPHIGGRRGVRNERHVRPAPVRLIHAGTVAGLGLGLVTSHLGLPVITPSVNQGREGKRFSRLGAATMLVNFYGPRVPSSRGIVVGRHPRCRSGRCSRALSRLGRGLHRTFQVPRPPVAQV